MALVCSGAARCGPPDPSEPDPQPPRWDVAFEDPQAGSLSSVWGTGPQDVFVVGGGADGVVYHYDGQQWAPMTVPQVPLLVWVYGFSPSDVYAVGVGGGALHYNGTNWERLDTGLTDDLWGVFGLATNDLWVVGGDVNSGAPVLLHYDGQNFTRVDIAPSENRVGATALFKVWGIGARVFAVGQRGLILEQQGSNWVSLSAGALADSDFVSLWGAAPDNIVAVGGRGNARIARFDGTAWSTVAPVGIGGINGVFMNQPDQTLMVGVNGWAGVFTPLSGALTSEDTHTSFDLHAVWEDGAGHAYAVGGNFLSPFRGVALVRTQP